jgi:excisionase family DNA binding protein
MTSRSQLTCDRDTEVAVLDRVRGRRQRDNQIRFLTITEVAERLHVSVRTVRRWIDAGDLVAHRIGGIVRIAEGVHREG